MGFALSWCAVPEATAGRLLTQLKLIPSGDSEEIPESPIACGRLDTGWRVVWYNEFECPALDSDRLAALSSDHHLLVCFIEEHVMVSVATRWSGGQCVWTIAHDGQNGPRGLSVEGDTPDCLASIREEMEGLQKAEGGENADVDYLFEIPLLVAKTLVGFKHDEDCPHLIGGRFEVLTESR